jgi:hypothetical protein
VFVFRQLNDGHWNHEQTLLPSDPVSAHFFGYDVALDDAGDTAIIGAKDSEVDGLPQAGAAYVFEYNGEKWIETAKLTAHAPSAFGEFGRSVEISADGNTILIGETFFGGVPTGHFFRRNGDGWQNAFAVPGSGRQVEISGDLALLSGGPLVRVFAGVNDIDCNNNGQPDGCDIAKGVSADMNDNGVPDECEVLPDFNGDALVNIQDLLFLLNAWGTEQGDINGDGITNVNDLLALLGAWGALNPIVSCPDASSDDCCATHEPPGCNDPACCDSICEIDPFCCTTTWDAICVNHAQKLCGCAPPEGCGEADAGACCIPGGGGNGSPGCDDPECCETICDYVDSFCCEVQWDATCGDWAFQLCASCPPEECAPSAGPCCNTYSGPAAGAKGCSDPECCELVCSVDPFCCEIAWDGICGDQANDLCEICLPFVCMPDSGDCCEANGSPGCNEDFCCAGICYKIDAYCCEVEWDAQCAQYANELGCTVCQ